jgi:uncharacterized protein YcbK (DUF882 family)
MRALTTAICAAAACAALLPGVAFGDPPPAPSPAKAASAPVKRTASRAQAATPPGPIAASRTWHTAAAGARAPVDAAGHARLVLQGLNIPDRIELTARSERGGFSAEDLDRAAHVRREPSSGNEHPIDPHLLDFVYRVATHFQAPEVRVLSGYRTPHGSHRPSNHGRGRAMDCIFPGATDEAVAKFAREQGFVGVGVYPVSGFLHLDVRERSYFWVDTSGPGKRSRIRGILGDLAPKSDKDAAERGERSVGPFAIGGDVDRAVAAREPATAPATEEDDDDGPASTSASD